MKLRLAMAILLGPILSSLPFAEGAKASELDWLCGDFSFLGSSKVYTGKLSNGRPNGLVLFDARSESGRVLALYAWGPKRDGTGGQGCIPRFGKLDGDTLVVKLSRNTEAAYKFEQTGDVSFEWSQKKRNGKVEKLKATLEESR